MLPSLCRLTTVTEVPSLLLSSSLTATKSATSQERHGGSRTTDSFLMKAAKGYPDVVRDQRRQSISTTLLFPNCLQSQLQNPEIRKR